ncbi:MAG TPA: hypothetical protein VFY03_13110 [Woeseiaceae bacterium]|nr:hypothetical protein [Woeseiaceae bacterium]
MRRRNRLAVLLLLPALAATLSSTALAAIAVACRDCGEQADDRTVNLLVVPVDSTAIELAWTSDSDPAGDEATIRLYAGNPTFTDAIPDRGTVAFEAQGGKWVLSRSFTVAELGRGTFLTILVREDGNRREILDWRAHRVTTEAELAQQRDIRTSGGNWSVDITPALLQVTSGHGELPRSTGGDERAWWSLWATDGNISDADLDGADSGVAGIGVQVSTPWHARENWRDSIVGNLSGVQGHTTKFGELKWVELPDREINLGPGAEPVDIRHYYTIVTLHTNASVRTFSARDLGRGGNRRYFSHETSASLKPPPDPRFWSSYSRRDHGADPVLLDLLQRQVAASSVPGLPDIQVVDGDGGSAIYRVGLVASARPWEVEAAAAGDPPAGGFVAGFVGVDLIAARAGLGRVRVGDTGDGDGVFCALIRCDSDDKNLDLNDPPDGYAVAPPVASLDTISGKLPMSQGVPALAQRETGRLGEADAVRLPNLPSQTWFAVGANLRAGALIRKGGLFGTRVDNVVPIDSYAQFVIKMTVAVVPGADIVANEEMIAPAPEELEIVTKTPPPRGFFDWLEGLLGISAFGKWLLAGAIVVALLFLVPGLRNILSAALNLLAAAIDRAAKGLARQERP